MGNCNGRPMKFSEVHGKVAGAIVGSTATLLSYPISLGSSSNHVSESHPPHSTPTLPPMERLMRGVAEFMNTQETEAGWFVITDMEEQNLADPLKREMGIGTLQEFQNNLLEELKSLVGERRADALYRTHVCRSHILLVHGAGERERTLAEELRGRLIEEGQMVRGPWSINCGENILDAWQRLSSMAVAVVVLLSPTLFEDIILCRCLVEMQHSHPDTIVPLFLDPLNYQAMPQNLAFLASIIGRVVPENHWDPNSFIMPLLKKCRRLRHFCQEIKYLNSLVGELKVDPNYVCPCGTC